MIGAVGLDGRLNGLYPQYPSGRVERIKKLPPKDHWENQAVFTQNGEDKKITADTAYGRYAKELSSQASDLSGITYGENPYEQMRKSMDESFLAGQNIDCFA